MKHTIQNLIKRALVSLSIIDNGKTQSSGAQIKYMDNVANMETIYPYGLFSNAPVGSLVICLNNQGQEANRTGFAYSPPNRFIGLLEGEVIVGNSVTQASIKFSNDGSITVQSNSNLIVNCKSAIITAEDTTVNGNVNLGGSGGQGVARIGDTVVDGVIQSGSTIVKSI